MCGPHINRHSLFISTHTRASPGRRRVSLPIPTSRRAPASEAVRPFESKQVMEREGDDAHLDAALNLELLEGEGV